MPPVFYSEELNLQSKHYNKDLTSLKRRQLINISYPKSLLTARQFSIQHPWNYHDIVFLLHEKWEDILEKIFDEKLKIYSYSFPIPISSKKEPHISNLRAGRLIYQWVQMAENDIIQDATLYKVIAKTDISNFYPSIYTHSIAWAIEGRENARSDKECNLIGNKIDKLVQYANDGRTNGIPIGSGLSDLIAEIVLSDIDLIVSKQLKDLDFIAVRFKDDYRILCQNQEDAKKVLKELTKQLAEINLTLNENKTQINNLPDGLYRKHDR